jgi:hypothetical protein
LIEIRVSIEEARRQNCRCRQHRAHPSLLAHRRVRPHEVLGSERAAYRELIVVTLARQSVVGFPITDHLDE